MTSVKFQSERESFINAQHPQKLAIKNASENEVLSNISFNYFHDAEHFESEVSMTEEQHERALKNWRKAKRLVLGVARFNKYSKTMRLIGTMNDDIEGEENQKSFFKKLQKFQNTILQPLHTDEKQKVPKWKQFIPVLLPESNLLLFWNLIVLLLMIYTATIMPYRISFVENDSDGWKTIENVIDFLFIFDIMVTFNSSFYRSGTNILVRSRYEIAVNYIKSWFFIDLLASIPQNLILPSSQNKSTSLVRLTRLPKLYRMIRVIRFLKLAKTMKNTEYVQKLQDFFNVNFGLYRLLTFFVTAVMIAHISACIWYSLPKIYDETDFWVINLGLQDEEEFRLYLFSLYWAFATMFTLGFGDIHAFNSMEHILSIIWMLFGVGFYSFTIGTVSSILTSVETREKMLNNKLQILNTFAKETRLSKSIKEKIKKLLCYNSNKNFFSWIERQDLFKDLPSNLKNEVSV